MKNKIPFLPKGHSVVSPYIVVESVSAVIEFAKKVFDAEHLLTHLRPDGVVRHAAIKIGDSVIMLSEGSDSVKARPVMLHIYVVDADASYARALSAGGQSVMPPTTMYYGDRNGGVDACGIGWWMATHIEDVSEDELKKRSDEAFAKDRR